MPWAICVKRNELDFRIGFLYQYLFINDESVHVFKNNNEISKTTWGKDEFESCFEPIALQSDLINYWEKYYKKLTWPPKKDQDASISEIRTAIADYMESEGCSCCRDNDAHKEHKERLGKMLQVKKYSDRSGYNFSIYKTKKGE
jgi:hypothetical protein